MFWVSLISVVLLTLGIAGLAVGFGTAYPQFETENAAQIPTSFGELLFMMASIGLIGAVIVLEARPVYAYLDAMRSGTEPDPTQMFVGFGAAATLCLAATLIPLTLARRRLELLER